MKQNIIFNVYQHNDGLIFYLINLNNLNLNLTIEIGKY